METAFKELLTKNMFKDQAAGTAGTCKASSKKENLKDSAK